MFVDCPLSSYSFPAIHLRRSKGAARRAEHTFGLRFRAKAPSRRAHFWWRLIKNAKFYPRSLTIRCFQGNQHVTLSLTVLVRATAFQQTVLPPSRVLILCALARKPLKITDISKTGRRNMAETCAINFLTLVSSSTSIVIGGLRRLLLAVLM